MAKKAKTQKETKEEKKPLFSDRQRRVLLIIGALMILAVPIVDNFRCKSACLKRVKTPYPEIACHYECPWFWQKK